MRRRTWRQELRRRICAFAVVFAMLFSDTVPVLTPVSAEGQTQADTENQIQAKVLTCTKEEHLHTEDCYTDILTCGQEEAAPKYRNTFKVHRHTDDCRNAAGEIACGWQENVYYHTHNEFCRDADGKLVCGIEAKEPHTHTDECWKTDQILICENNDPGHTHSDACYESHTRLTCGQEEKEGHTHTDACYTEHRELTCGQTEKEGHAHSDACYTEHTKLTCDREEDDGHTHTDACWTEHTDLTCGLEENEEHQHSEACYTTTRELTCGQEEREGHHHGEECYTTTRELTCGKEEKKGHSHSDSCYTTTRELTCGKQEEEGHHHTDACYPTEQNLICGQKERPAHVHSDECYEETKTLICEEPTSTHKHKAECFDEQGFCICGKVEVPVFESTAANWTEGHTHTDACYEKQLICTREEHHHTDECYEAEEPKEAEEKEELQPEAEQTAEEELATEEELFEKEEPTDNEETTDNQELTDNEDLTDNEGLTDDKESTDDEEPIGDEKTQEEEETPDGTTVLSTKEDSPIPVTITFSAEAGIPKETELVVTDPNAAPVLRSASPKKMPGTAKMESSNKAEADEPSYADIPLTEWQAGEKAPEIQLYHRRLDISLVANGKEIEPNPDSPVTVTVTLPDLEEGLTVEVRHETENGSILLDSTTEGQYVTFTTDGFSIFDFTSTAQRITSWTSDLLENTLFGRSENENAEHNSINIDENSIPDGFSILEAFSTTQSNNLWLMMQRVKDFALGKLESINLYAVEDGKLAGLVKENIGITDVLRFNLGNYSSFALVRDSGLRNKVEELGNVILSGLMPKNGLAEATDVMEEYADFVPSKSVEQGEADETSIEQGETVDTENGEAAHTIAAYDISITNDGEEYQPEDKPIEVTIKDEAIAKAVANGNAISLWHVIDENTAEQITDFTVSSDTVTFSATGFSVYVVTETTVEKILTAADGKIYRITVTYDGSAQIPEGAELVVNEVDEGDYLASAATALGVDESYLLYRKFLDISFKVKDENGERTIEPATPVQVKIELLDVDAGADKLQVVHFGETGAEKVTATANENAVVTFSAGEFSVFGFGNVLEPIDTVETDEASVEILGFGTETQLIGVDAPEVEEGLEVLGTYNLSDAGENKLWIRAELKEGVDLTDMESVAIYSFSSDETDGQNVAELAEMDTITELPTTEFAVVKDTGYRHLSFNLTPDEEGTKTVSLDGMMPKNAEAAATDVTENYTDHEFTESALIYNEETGAESTPVDEAGEEEQEETADDAGEQQEAADDHTTQRSTIAAFNISISNNSVDYQPDADHPVAVVITDERILPGNNLELWHIKDDGTEERVEDFSITTGTLSFTATGFSTYALVSTITTYYQTASGETYKITVEYGEDTGLPADVALRITEVDGSDYLADAATALGTTDSYLLYKKFFDISFVRTDEDGKHIIEPNAPVNVTIELLDVTAGADKLQVVHFGADGAEKITATATEEAVVSFTSSEFSVFGIGNVLTPIATAETDEANIEILGFGGEAQINTADAPAVEEGLEVLGAYSLSNEAEKVWIKADVKDGVELTSMESVVIYGVKEESAEERSEEQAEQGSETVDEQSGEQAEGQNTPQSTTQITELAAAGTVAELTVPNFALVKDTGYRHLNFEISVGGETQQEETEEGTSEAQDEETGDATANVIILDGMMPKKAGATAVDVTDAYADHEYAVPEEEQIDDQEQTDELNTEADGEEIPEEQPVSNDAGENDLEQPVVDEEVPEEPQDGAEEEIIPTRTTLAAFNITISNDNFEYQPDENHPISVVIRDSRIVAGENIELWHIKDDGTEERVEEFTIEDGRVEFTATGFSAYAIVQGPEPGGEMGGIIEITDMESLVAQINQGRGFYIDGVQYTGYYFMDTEINANNGTTSTGGRRGIQKVKPSVTSPLFANSEGETAVLYYFETVSEANSQYKIYCGSGTSKKYIKQDDKSLKLVAEAQATTFTLGTGSSTGDDQHKDIEYTGITIKSGSYYCTMQGGKNGHSYAAYNGLDANCLLRFLYEDTTAEEVYGLNGKSYGLMFWNGGVAGKALMSSSANANTLDAKAMEVMVKENNLEDKLFVPSDSDISTWTFNWVKNDEYHLSTKIDGITKYLKIDSTGLSLVDTDTEASDIRVVPGTGTHAGQIYLKSGNNTISYSGKVADGFGVGVGSAGNEWLNLVEYSDLTAEYMVTYTATKIGVSDTRLTNGSKIIVYTRKWNPTRMRYDFYAVDHDGSLVLCFESGDTIQWIGNRVNTKLWNFVEYYWEGTTDPNYYYELYNEYSQKYIAPQVTGGQTLSSNKIGINLDGRKKGYFYSTVTAWDEGYYSYVGLKANTDDKIIESCPIGEADDFYFAILQDVELDDDMTLAPTVINAEHGITMRIKDFDSRATMSGYLGSDSGGATLNTVDGLLSTNLDPNTGYPTITKKGTSLGTMLSGASVVDGLFLAGTYNGSGYFTYDSTQNFATLVQDDGTIGSKFKVYRELGTYDSNTNGGGNKPSMKHGQFLPFNDLKPGEFATVNGLNLYDAKQKLLSDNDPRKNEQLYNVEYDGKSKNLFFAVELEASFVQTPSGHDNWGHDIIYEFTGDDDFWLYVDGELVIDLGGIHSALPGSVNYHTGAVNVNGTNTTLYQLFYDNYVGRGHTAQEALEYVDGDQYPETGLFTKNSEGNWVFKDYTTHTMKIFYMERGGGASNLNMRFNLASVKDGHVELSKKIEGVESIGSLMAEFPYQIWYKKTENSPETLLSKENNSVDIKVYYKDTSTNVTYKPTFTVDGITYQSVFMLKPGEVADIEIPDNAIWYKIIECGLNTDVFHEEVKVEGETKDLTVEVNEGKEPVYSGKVYNSSYTYPTNRLDYYIDYAQTRSRSRAAFVNSVDPDAVRTLTIEKHLFDTDGITELVFDENEHQDTTVFGFRLYLASELDDGAGLADKYTYHVINPSGIYCKWDAENQRFVPLGAGKTDYTSFTAEEKQLVSFHTSMNGSISKIPASYKVQVRDLLVGTKYMVEERNYEIPDGYSLRDYKIYADDGDTNPSSTILAGEELTEETVGDNKDPKVVINNLKGFGIRIYKDWNDADYMEYRAPTYFAVFTGTDDSNLTLVNGTVRQLTQNKNTLYWYFDALNNIPFANYRVREVAISSNTPSVDSDGVVTNYGTATPIVDGGTLTIQGTQKGETGTSPQEYTVDYEQGTPTQEKPNIRVDNITNSRQGLVIRKEDWEGNGLGETTFTLKDENYTSGSSLLNATYTSYINPDDENDSDNGYVTTAFLTKNTTYTLTETKAKTGYLGLQNPLTITVDNNGDVSVSGETVDADFYVLSADHKTLTIKNKPFTLTVAKRDKDTDLPLSGAKFELHKQITVGGYTTFDFTPLTGYTDDILITGADGVIPKLDETLPAGTYRLDETFAPAGYVKWSTGLEFTVNGVGKITLGSRYPDGTELLEESKVVNNRVIYEYILKIPNSADSKWPSLTITKQVTGDMADYDKDFTFTITLHNIDENASFDYSIGTETGTVTVNASHQITKNLKHGQSLEIARLPLNTEITVAEATGTYTTTWKKDDVAVTATNNAITFRLTDNVVVEVTNDMPAVAPTNFSTRHTPFLLLLLFGLMLLIGGGVVLKRRKGIDSDTGGTVAVNTIPTNTGPPGGATSMTEPRKPVDTPQPTYSTTDAESHIRWRNSVWVEERANGSHRGYVPPAPQVRRNVSCPQTNLWMNSGGGGAG